MNCLSGDVNVSSIPMMQEMEREDKGEQPEVQTQVIRATGRARSTYNKRRDGRRDTREAWGETSQAVSNTFHPQPQAHIFAITRQEASS